MPARLTLRPDHHVGPSVRDYAADGERRRRDSRAGRARTLEQFALAVPEREAPLNLDAFPQQREWLSAEVDQAREVVWRKSAQVGMSAYAWRWAARRVEQFGERVGIWFPTDDDVRDFGDARIEPSIRSSRLLSARMDAESIRHKGLKQIGTGFLYLRGMRSKSGVQSADLDAQVFDEYDYLDVRNLAQAERRLAGAMQSGRQPRIRRLGYPTIVGGGIDRHYANTQRRTWRVTCPGCGEEQPLTWESAMRWRSEAGGDVMRHGHDDFAFVENVVEAWRACRTCDASLEARGDRRPIHEGRWVAENPDAETIGYHAQRLTIPGADLLEMVRSSRKTAPHDVEAFFQNDLGIPYEAAESSLTLPQIEAVCTGQPMELGPGGRSLRVAGLDIASMRELTLWCDDLGRSGNPRAAWLSEPADAEEAVRQLKILQPDAIAIDDAPEPRTARAIAAQFPGRAVTVRIQPPTAEPFTYDEAKNRVSINRTQAIDAMQDSIRFARRELPVNPPRRLPAQLAAPRRRTRLDTKGRVIREYVSVGSEGDDFTFAGVFATVAKQMLDLMGIRVEHAARARGQALTQPPPPPFRQPGSPEGWGPGFGENELL